MLKSVADTGAEDHTRSVAEGMVEAPVPIDLRDEFGRHRTESLFFERNRSTNYTPLFTLKERDHKGCISLRRLYMKHNDVAEHRFAKLVFGSWDHWQRLLRCEWFTPYISLWRAELETQRLSLYIGKLEKFAAKTDGLAATRLLIDKPWAKKTGAGRPSKADVQNETRNQAAVERLLDEDSERVGLT